MSVHEVPLCVLEKEAMSADKSVFETMKERKPLTVDSTANWQLPLLAILFVLVVFVAIKTVVHRHEARTSFMELQSLEKERDKLAAQWSRLKLEQGTALNRVKVEQYARWDLGMKIPKASEVKIVREQSPIESHQLDIVDLDSAVKPVPSKVALGE